MSHELLNQALSRDSRFSFPRDIQTEVLSQWYDQRNQEDNIIKLNVGSGKTLVGLLILQSSLNEGIGQALYVAPDSHLTSQAITEANLLNIPTVEDPRDPRYSSGSAICITNVHKLFNGRSVFGVKSSLIDIGSVVIDDVHACAASISKQFQINTSRDSQIYQHVFAEVRDELQRQSGPTFLDVEVGDPQAYIEVPFWAWIDKNSRILEILHENREEDDIRFSYPFISKLLPQCRCVIGGQALQIKPVFPAPDLIQSFRRSQRRVYMSATLSDDSIIATHFGASTHSLLPPIVPKSSQSLGERMIIAPQELNSNINRSQIRLMVKELSVDYNVVVIVPSIKSADAWIKMGANILSGESVSPGVEKLRNQNCGLTVLVNAMMASISLDPHAEFF